MSTSQAGRGRRFSLQSFAHRYRNYVRPADYLAYGRVVKRLRARTAQLEFDPDRSVLFEFSDPLIDRENGRYAYNLVRDFIDAGYHVFLQRNFWYLSTMERKTHKRLLLAEKVALFDPEVCRPGPTLLITDRSDSKWRHRSRCTLFLDYRTRLANAENVLRFPYRQNPAFHAAELPLDWPDLGDHDRPTRVSFLGHWSERHYDNERKLDEFGVASRWRMIQAVCASLEPRQLERVSGSPTDLPAGDFVLADDEDLPDLSTYARLLRRSNFFLACPGTAFPLCHNLAESMLLGCIPIVQRPELTDLGLIPGVNCMTFANLEELPRVVRECSTMPQDRIHSMRASLAEVVSSKLAPGSFARALELGEGSDPRSLALYWFERSR